jgi:transcriptional regulator with XRE-family HTH domain
MIGNVSLTLESNLGSKMETPGGKRLKALRDLAGRTQLDVELDASLGTGYLQRVESGKVQRPERETLERILLALGAQYSERRDILELFGYVVDAPLPDEAEIAWAIAVCRDDMDSAVFPAYLLDCGHRLLAWNALTPRLYRFLDNKSNPLPLTPSPLRREGEQNQKYTIHGQNDLHQSQQRNKINRVSMLRLVFDAAYGVMPLITNPDVFFPAQIRAFRYEMSHFPGAVWASAVMDDLMGCATFVHYWRQAELQPSHPVAARPLAPLEIALPDAGLLQFRLVSERFASDRRFRVLYALPVDGKTMGWCLG